MDTNQLVFLFLILWGIVLFIFAIQGFKISRERRKLIKKIFNELKKKESPDQGQQDKNEGLDESDG